ncbi:aminopeptidase N-like [Bradysia coprophila]|uniref:aminopeptidase N-like n=1 Tax=Bradysia coprophila TaxID=38358 RepID=UPI00187D8C79|nr:aminopeptidase N-like [Bradysia coprophila]
MTRSAPVWLFTAIVFIALTDKICAAVHHPITQRDVKVEPRQDEGRRYRLPNDTVPETYDITLTTRIDNADFVFNGSVRIGIYVNESTQLITLHHRQLTVINVQLWTTASPAQEVVLGAYSYDPVLEFLQIPVTVNLTAGARYTLSIDYIGTLRVDNYGFYRSSYRNDNGDQIWLATTQFESTDARHAFPCYDEPQLKAVFTTTIVHGSSYTALSNMPVTTGYPIVHGDGTTTTRFDPTPPMSTYLNAFVVSDFASTGSVRGRVPQRVFGRSSEIIHSTLTLNAGIDILDSLERYLGVNYSLPKMDQIAIPDFGPGAMENWGLVTYREIRFFFNDAVDDYNLKTAIVTTIAHELGHQWFGNLIGPRWWDVIWLNEGFANLFGFIGTDEVYPDWRFMEYFVVSTLHNVFQLDALEDTRPMTYYVESPEAISYAFDNIAYAKSGCVLRMFLHALSQRTFVKGLNNYLTTKAYSAASEEDLFNALQSAIQEDGLQLPTSFTNIMSSWTRQKGFPVVTVERNYESSTVTLDQQRYVSELLATPDPARWWIPYNLATASSANFDETTATHWLSANSGSQTITVANLNANDWLLLNKKETGYYRVKYDTRNYELISHALYQGGVSQMHALSRAQLLDDAFNFARNDQLSYAVFLNLTRFLQKDNDYIPWAPANTAFTFLDRMFASHASHNVFRDYIRKLTESMYDAVFIDDVVGEPHIRKYGRSLIIKLACEMGSTHCRGDTLNRLRLLTGTDDFHQNVRPEMYCGAMRTSLKADFDRVWRRLLDSSDSSYRNMLINALACTTSTDLLSTYLSSSLPATNPFPNNVTYRPEELVRVFNAVYQSGPVGLRLAIPFLTTNINAASMTFGNSNLGSIYFNMALRIGDHTLHHQFDMLTQALGPIITADEASEADSEIMSNVKWVETHGPVIDAWLKEHHTSGSATLVLSSVMFVAAVVVSITKYF